MQTITINERTKVGEIVGYPDGYYIIKDNPIVLKASGADGETAEIAPDTIIKIEHADSPFHPLVTITNCDDDVTYYINSVLQTGAEYISYDTADKPSESGGGGELSFAKIFVTETSENITIKTVIPASFFSPDTTGVVFSPDLTLEAGNSYEVLMIDGAANVLTTDSIAVVDGDGEVITLGGSRYLHMTGDCLISAGK